MHLYHVLCMPTASWTQEYVGKESFLVCCLYMGNEASLFLYCLKVALCNTNVVNDEVFQVSSK